jgi:hypothetical protein
MLPMHTTKRQKNIFKSFVNQMNLTHKWAAKVPQNQEDLRELKALGARLKERYKPKDN